MLDSVNKTTHLWVTDVCEQFIVGMENLKESHSKKYQYDNQVVLMKIEAIYYVQQSRFHYEDKLIFN